MVFHEIREKLKKKLNEMPTFKNAIYFLKFY